MAAIVQGNTLTVANAGDSRCVLCRKGKAIAMTEDHKPTTPEEHDRIMKVLPLDPAVQDDTRSAQTLKTQGNRRDGRATQSTQACSRFPEK